MKSYLTELKNLSQQVKDGGITGEGAINYILDTFTPTVSFEKSLNKKKYVLKEIVVTVLGAVPSTFPKNIDEVPFTKEQLAFIEKIENKFAVDIDKYDVQEIVRLAQKYEMQKRKEIEDASPHNEYYEGRS